MAGIARPVVHGRRKQSTKVLRELIQMTAEKNWKIFRDSCDVQIDTTHLSALPSAVTINARVSSRPWNRLWLYLSIALCESLRVNLDSIQGPHETALMVAARKGRVGIVKKLIQHGASVNLKNKVNWLIWWALIPCIEWKFKNKFKNGMGFYRNFSASLVLLQWTGVNWDRAHFSFNLFKSWHPFMEIRLAIFI